MIELECRLQQKSQQVDEVLRAVETCNLRLTLLISLAILRLLVVYLLIADGAHLLRIAILDVERVLTLEEHIPSEFLRHLALVLLFEVDEGLLRAGHNVHATDLTLACSLEVDLELLGRRANREVLDEQTEEHDRLFELEIAHLQLGRALRLLLCLANIQVRNFDAVDFQVFLSAFILDFNVVLVVFSLGAHDKLDCLYSSGWVLEADEAKAF